MERLSKDSCDALELVYRQNYGHETSKMVRDISCVWRQLTDWMTVESAEAIIPFNFGNPKKQPVGYRIWALSRHQGERYYAGDFFDCTISKTEQRTRRLKCKLSSEAIKFFSEERYAD